MFVVFEGIDGAGKTTQLHMLERALAARGYRPVVVREPGSTRIGEAIREVLLSPAYAEMAPATEALLYVAARAQAVAELVRPALAGGRPVLADRFSASTVAYQGYGRGLDLTVLREIDRLATGGLAPDLTILLDLAPEEALARLRGNKSDRLEQETMAFYTRVREGYLELAAREGYLVLDATLPPGELAREVLEKVLGRV
ncbi:MAG: Thymidylate kinase [Clostridia bacterium 62_21]|nr:MAG: Thymidylate kinase [Clostridia bacterium 62_21]